MPDYYGVTYDTGTNFATGQGDLSRNVLSTPELLKQLDMISDQLHCNSVTVYGSELDRLTEAVTAAAERDLHVVLDPRLVDRPHTDILDHLAEVARLAEDARGQGASISLTVGAAHTIFTPGIIAGDAYHERMANIYADGDHFLLSPTGKADMTEAAPRLDAYLAKAAAVARGIFSGEVSYSAAPYEQVDWDRFDAIGLMYYYQPVHLTPEQHVAGLTALRKWNKPVDIAGFGTATYAGAEERAFFFWDIVDRSSHTELSIVDGYVRDEAAQAAYHRKMFGVFERAGVRGVTVTDFIHPTHPHAPGDPRLDLDTASLCIVKTIRDDVADHSSAYRWEPKESFHAIAEYYAGLGG
jgi:hypothetical protein